MPNFGTNFWQRKYLVSLSFVVEGNEQKYIQRQKLKKQKIFCRIIRVRIHISRLFIYIHVYSIYVYFIYESIYLLLNKANTEIQVECLLSKPSKMEISFPAGQPCLGTGCKISTYTIPG